MSKDTLQWEQIDNYHKRAKVVGGWLVKAYEDILVDYNNGLNPEAGYSWQVSMCFVPDPTYEWRKY